VILRHASCIRRQERFPLVSHLLDTAPAETAKNLNVRGCFFMSGLSR
jgi:hypothetical protein